MTVKNILIASDLSSRSDRAVARGLALAEALGARATVISVADEALPASIAQDVADKSRAHLEATLKEAGATHRCDIIVEIADPLTCLVDMGNDPKFDLIVAGRHRTRGFLDGLRQTTIERVISLVLKPVLLVVEPTHGPYERVVAPVAFSGACRRAVATAYAIAQDAEFRLIHAWMAPFEGLTGGKRSNLTRAVERETREQAVEWARHLPDGLPAVELMHGGVGPALGAAMRDAKPDLIAVGGHTRSVAFTGLGAFTGELVRDPPTDLLVATSANG